MNILNTAPGQDQEASRDAQELAKNLQRSMLRMKGDHMTSDGKGVDYASLSTSEAFMEYCRMAGELVTCDCTTMSEEERKAFFISILSDHGWCGGYCLCS